MRHRAGRTSRRTRDPRLLPVVGLVLVLAALAMSRCDPEDLPGGSSSKGFGWLYRTGGEQV
jgi:hypothetical protein